MRSDGAALMHFALCLEIGRMSKLWGFMGSKAMRLIVRSNRGRPQPQPLNKTDTQVWIFGSRIWVSAILQVDAARHVTQISPAIVMTNAVLMVGIVLGPFTSHIQECQAMRQIFTSINADVNIFLQWVPGSSYIADFSSTRTNQSSKQARTLAVFQEFLQTFLREHTGSLIRGIDGEWSGVDKTLFACG